RNDVKKASFPRSITASGRPYAGWGGKIPKARYKTGDSRIFCAKKSAMPATTVETSELFQICPSRKWPASCATIATICSSCSFFSDGEEAGDSSFSSMVSNRTRRRKRPKPVKKAFVFVERFE